MRRRRPFRGQRPPIPGPGWLRSPRGATMVEYLVMLILGVLILLAALQIFGNGIMHELDRATNYIASAVDEDARGHGDERQRSRERASSDGERSATASRDRDSGATAAAERSGRDSQEIQVEEKEEDTPGSVGGVNPFIILLVIGGIIAAGYFMFGDGD